MIAVVLSIIYTHILHIQYYSENCNPYDPDDSGKFKLPIGILDEAHDKYGQITGQNLNTVLEYEYLNRAGGDDILTTPDGPEFSFYLNDQIEKAFILSSINVQIKIYQECMDDVSNKVEGEMEGSDTYSASMEIPCVGCKFILVYILLIPYLRTLCSHLMLYMYHILP